MPSLTIVGATLSQESITPYSCARLLTVWKKTSWSKSLMVRRMSRSTRSPPSIGTPA